MALTAEFLYCASNVFNAAGVWQNSLVWRFRLDDLAAGTAQGAFYRHTGGTGPMGQQGAYRFTQTYAGQPGTTMYWGCADGTTAGIAIFAWSDGAGARQADVTHRIPAWTGGAGTSVGPDGRDWIGSDDHRFASGYVSATEGGFLWTSRDNGTTRLQNYIRVCRFSTSDRSIVANDDVFHSNLDVAYPACGVNSLGHIGVVMSTGSTTQHVRTVGFLVDNYSSAWTSQTISTMAPGVNGSNINRWGDYHTVVANPIDPRTFLGTGMEMAGTANVMHRYAWFGRDDFAPTWVDLVVGSTVNAVAIAVDATDRNGARDGVTPFTRSYTPRQGIAVTAPLWHTAGNVYVFERWVHNGIPQPIGQTTLVITDIGTAADTADASYRLRRSLTIASSRPSSGVSISVDPADVNGSGSGLTPLGRYYRDGDAVTLTAPRGAGANLFKRWMVNGAPQPIGQQTLILTMTQDHSVVAEFLLS